jgi:hypothetical protein
VGAQNFRSNGFEAQDSGVAGIASRNLVKGLQFDSPEPLLDCNLRWL